MSMPSGDSPGNAYVTPKLRSRLCHLTRYVTPIPLCCHLIGSMLGRQTKADGGLPGRNNAATGHFWSVACKRVGGFTATWAEVIAGKRVRFLAITNIRRR